MKHTTILAIETSCDDTSASIISDGLIQSNIISSQINHAKLGGVVPEIASREHQKNIIFIVERALNKANKTKKDLDAVAFTNGPGLLGSLLVGSSFAKSFSYGLNIPLIAVNHISAHALSHTINLKDPIFPFISLIVSGGHTQIVLVQSYDNIETIGETRDDAVGEAFDKCAKIIGLDYPGGPLIDKLSVEGDENKFQFPDTRVPDFDFSFSGIKTSFLYFIRDKMKKDNLFIEKNLHHISASIQNKLIDMLIEKLVRASIKYKIKEISMGGGVAANSLLRKKINFISKQNNWNVYIPKISFCTDNAAMIANYANFMFRDSKFSDISVVPYSRL